MANPTTHGGTDARPAHAAAVREFDHAINSTHAPQEVKLPPDLIAKLVDALIAAVIEYLDHRKTPHAEAVQQAMKEPPSGSQR
jgi:hypothetical protein